MAQPPFLGMHPPGKDLFSKQSSHYAQFRPKYPPSLFTFLASLTAAHELAWDVGTGNGQAATELAKHYQKVVATDVSAAQLQLATSFPNVEYKLSSTIVDDEEAQRLVGEPGTVDLITVAQALHWFDLERFYAQARRMLRKPGGVLAAWTYGLPRISAAVDAVTDEFYASARPHFEPQRQYIDDEYKTIPFLLDYLPSHQGSFPFEEQSVSRMTCGDFLGFLRSWSAVTEAEERGIHLLSDDFQQQFMHAWGGPDELRDVKYTLHILVGMAGG